jgi:hypothetical protein
MDFYGRVQTAVVAALPRRNDIFLRGIDIGAGPGVGAKLLAEAGIKISLAGYEPSDTHFDGINLAERLRRDGSALRYFPVHGGIHEVLRDYRNGRPVDFVMITRAAHEIAMSLKGKQQFNAAMADMALLIRRNGFLVVADSEYNAKIYEEPERYAHWMRLSQQWQMENTGHAHVPSDYVRGREMKEIAGRVGLELVSEHVDGYEVLFRYCNARDPSVTESPNMFYVQTYLRRS